MTDITESANTSLFQGKITWGRLRPNAVTAELINRVVVHSGQGQVPKRREKPSVHAGAPRFVGGRSQWFTRAGLHDRGTRVAWIQLLAPHRLVAKASVVQTGLRKCPCLALAFRTQAEWWLNYM